MCRFRHCFACHNAGLEKGSTSPAGPGNLRRMKAHERNILAGAVVLLVAGALGFWIGRGSRPDPSAASKRAPLIGIASLTGENYARAVRESGGIPVVLPNAEGNAAMVPQYLEMLDGLLMPGGADIPPSEYGEETHESVEILDEDRFTFEKELIHAWIAKTDKPLLGICLGSQWINVAKGGSLVQDIPTEIGGNHRDTNHPVKLEPGSRLAAIFGGEEIEVNSFHHQAVDPAGLGEGLRAVAVSPDGVVEATESTDPDRFLIGVQWHPEKMMPDDQTQAKLIEAFVQAAAGE